ncbi:MAG: hypothetical protein KBA14_04410 [Saprospiraceae bacterium]|nr:hypothetical protein [Saprospiraceae bacterium]
MDDFTGLITKVQRYQGALANTKSYRERWGATLKAQIISDLENMLKITGLQGAIEASDKIKHLEYIILSLGTEESGIAEIVNDKLTKPLIKTNGTLVYQQLYNGKIQVMIGYPFIEGFGEPRPPKLISIYRPEEIKTPFILRHMEEFIKEITQWEDFDDDDHIASKIGYQVQGLQPTKPPTGEE